MYVRNTKQKIFNSTHLGAFVGGRTAWAAAGAKTISIFIGLPIAMQENKETLLGQVCFLHNIIDDNNTTVSIVEKNVLHTIKGNAVELAVGDGSITDTGEVDDGGSGRLSILVVHEGALLQGSDSGGEDELVIPIPIPLRRVEKEGSIVMWRRFEENARGNRRKAEEWRLRLLAAGPLFA